MLQSFLVYGLTSVLLVIWGSVAAKRERINNKIGKPTPFWTWEIVFSLLLFAVISGIRWQVGVDHLTYLDNYLTYKNAGFFQIDKEVGFEFITKLFAKANIHFTIYFGFLAFLQLFFIYYAVKKERYLLPFIGLIIIMGPHYLSWMNGMRQMLAATMFVYAVQFIKERKLLKYFLFIGLASLMHKSAILLMIFYFIPQKNYFKNRYVNLILLFGTLIVGAISTNWFKPSGATLQVLEFIGYERYAEKMSHIIEAYAQDMAIGPRRITILLSYSLVIWYFPKLKQRFKNTNFLIYFNLSFIGILLYNLLSNIGNAFLRPVSYFTIFSILTIAYLLYYLRPSKKYHATIPFIFASIIAISYMILSIIATATESGTDFTNFKFFWDYAH